MLDDIKKTLWLTADKLRANMDAAEYKHCIARKRSDETRELAIRQIISQAVVSERVVDIFDAVGLDKPNIGLLDEEFLAQVRKLPEKNLAVELL